MLGLSGCFGRHAIRGARPEARYALALTIMAAMAVAPAATFYWVYKPSFGSSPIRTSSAERRRALVRTDRDRAQRNTAGGSPIAGAGRGCADNGSHWRILLSAAPVASGLPVRR